MNGTTIHGGEVHNLKFNTDIVDLYPYDISRSGTLTYNLHGNRLKRVPYSGCCQSNRSTKRGLVWKTSVPRSRLARRCDGGLLIGRPLQQPQRPCVSGERITRSAYRKSLPDSGCQTPSEGHTDNPAIRSPTSLHKTGLLLTWSIAWCLKREIPAFSLNGMRQNQRNSQLNTAPDILFFYGETHGYNNQKR